jgi:hypothetical protein
MENVKRESWRQSTSSPKIGILVLIMHTAVCGILVTQYSNSQGGSTRIQTANQQQIGRPKLGGKKGVSNTTSNH